MKTQTGFKTMFLLSLLTISFMSCNKSKDHSGDLNTQGSYNQNNEMNFKTEDESSVPNSVLMKDGIAPASQDQMYSEKIPVAFGRMIIKTGTINIEIQNFDESERKLLQEVAKYNGFVTNSNSARNASENKQGKVQVRIPAGNYDAFIQSISSLGKVMSQNISGTDVTEEYIDLEARQKTQKELESRLLELLKEKTAKLTDVVEVEQKLSGVRENIERTEGRMNYLKSQSAFSTLIISLFEPSFLQTASGGGFLFEIGEAVKDGLKGFTEVLSGLISFMIAFSPVIIFVIILLIIIKRFILKKKMKRSGIQVQVG